MGWQAKLVTYKIIFLALTVPSLITWCLHLTYLLHLHSVYGWHWGITHPIHMCTCCQRTHANTITQQKHEGWNHEIAGLSAEDSISMEDSISTAHSFLCNFTPSQMNWMTVPDHLRPVGLWEQFPDRYTADENSLDICGLARSSTVVPATFPTDTNNTSQCALRPETLWG
jgi:hypothetical protein